MPGAGPEIDSFFRRLDDFLFERSESLQLFVFGGAAIILSYARQAHTKDVDALGPRTTLLDELARFAGKGSAVHRETGLYFDLVPPIHPQAPNTRDRAIPLDLPGLRALSVRVLELHDLIITKLQRFSDADYEDIERLIQHPGFSHETLIERYRTLRADYIGEDALLEKLDGNLNTVLVEAGEHPKNWDLELP